MELNSDSYMCHITVRCSLLLQLELKIPIGSARGFLLATPPPVALYILTSGCEPCSWVHWCQPEPMTYPFLAKHSEMKHFTALS